MPPKVTLLSGSGVVCVVKWSCYAGGSVAIGRASRARQIIGDDPHKKGYPGLPGWGSGVGLPSPPH